MKSPRLEVCDDFVDLALSAPEAILAPGHNPEALQWVIEQDVQPDTLGSFAVVWTLSERQKRLFSDELAAPTPRSYPAAAEHMVGRYGILQLLISSSLGLPYGLPHQRNGVLLQDVFPKEGLFERANSGLGATQAFDFHTDQAFCADPAQRPNYVTLACVRNKERAVTGMVSLADIVDELDTETIQCLSSNAFKVYTGRAHEDKGVDIGSILTVNEDGIATIRLGGDVEGTTRETQAALSQLKNILETKAHKEPIVLEPGDILGFDNTISIHFRSSFIPEPDPDERRWIRKAYIRAEEPQ